MPKLPVLSGKELIKLLCKIGFQHIRTRGSHAILNKIDNEKGKITLPVPLHSELAKGTLILIVLVVLVMIIVFIILFGKFRSGYEIPDDCKTSPEATLRIMFDISKSDRVSGSEVDISSFCPGIGNSVSEGEYSLRVLDKKKKILYERKFEVDFVIFSDPPTLTDSSTFYECVKYDCHMNEIQVYHNDNLIYSPKINTFCNYDGVCNSNENYWSCINDCESLADDSICNRDSDGYCDLDCIPGLDPDCNDLSAEILSVSNSNPVTGDIVTIKVNVSNKGANNFSSLLLGFTVGGRSVENRSISLNADSSQEINFNWVAEFGEHTLYFLIDEDNSVNELNNSNNQAEVSINSI